MGGYLDIAKKTRLKETLSPNRVRNSRNEPEPGLSPTSGNGRRKTLDKPLYDKNDEYDQSPEEKDRRGSAATRLLSDPPKWLRLMLDRHATGHVSEIKMTHPDGKARPTRVRITTKTLCANVAAAIGLSPLDWGRVQPEVEEVARVWEPSEKMEVVAYD